MSAHRPLRSTGSRLPTRRTTEFDPKPTFEYREGMAAGSRAPDLRGGGSLQGTVAHGVGSWSRLGWRSAAPLISFGQVRRRGGQMDAAIGIGISKSVDGYEAATTAAISVRDELGPEGADFIFVFSTIGYEQEDVLDGVREILGDVPMSGATFEGIIGRDIADESMYAVQIVGIRSNKIKFHSFSTEDIVRSPLGSRAQNRVQDRVSEGSRKQGRIPVPRFPIQCQSVVRRDRGTRHVAVYRRHLGRQPQVPAVPSVSQWRTERRGL